MGMLVRKVTAARGLYKTGVSKQDSYGDLCQGVSPSQIAAKVAEFKRIAPVVTDGKVYPQDAYDAGDEAKRGLMKVLFSLSEQAKWNEEMAKHGFYFKTAWLCNDRVDDCAEKIAGHVARYSGIRADH